MPAKSLPNTIFSEKLRQEKENLQLEFQIMNKRGEMKIVRKGRNTCRKLNKNDIKIQYMNYMSITVRLVFQI